MSPYKEENPAHPLNIYGKSKLAGEQAVTQVGIPHIIIRTSWVYSLRGNNFLITIQKLAQTKKQIKVVCTMRPAVQQGARGRPKTLPKSPKFAPEGPGATQGRLQDRKREPRRHARTPKEIQGSLQGAPRDGKRDPMTPREAQSVQPSRPEVAQRAFFQKKLQK